MACSDSVDLIDDNNHKAVSAKPCAGVPCPTLTLTSTLGDKWYYHHFTLRFTEVKGLAQAHKAVSGSPGMQTQACVTPKLHSGVRTVFFS